MPAKTDRILGHLPATFRPLPRPSALFALLDAVGAELQDAENSLAAVLQAHWVDLADRGADEIADLAALAGLYGLRPRPDESVEEFRAHLKRYVRTFLDGTVTVRGLLRITAEALGLRIADGPGQLDAWWTRRSPWLETTPAAAASAPTRVAATPTPSGFKGGDAVLVRRNAAFRGSADFKVDAFCRIQDETSGTIINQPPGTSVDELGRSKSIFPVAVKQATCVGGGPVFDMKGWVSEDDLKRS